MEWILLYAIVGVLVGFMAGMLGVGGILVPLLASLFAYQGIEQSVHMALGTALSCNIITSAASARAHNTRRAVAWKVVGTMALGMMAGSYATSQMASKIDAVYIALLFSVFMALVAIQLFVDWHPGTSNRPTTRLTLVGVGIGIGSVAALATVGGGILTVWYLTYKNIEIRKAIGTSAAIGLPIAVAGSAGYMTGGWSQTSHLPYTLGYVYLPAFVILSVASVIGAPVGVRFSHSVSVSCIKTVFAVVTLLLSAKMLWSVI